MIQVGLTGNIGCGKSTVAKMFNETFNIPIFYSDNEAKRIMTENKSVKEQIIKLLGEESYIESAVNKSYIANIIFNDSLKLHYLNKIVHPVVEEYYNEWCNIHSDKKYTIKEAAILFESDSYKSCDKIITVACDYNTSVKRVMKRNNLNIKDVNIRLNNQLPQEEKILRSDYVIWNNDNDILINQIKNIHKLLMEI